MVRLVCTRNTTRDTMQLSSLVRTGTTSKWFATNPRPNPSIVRAHMEFRAGSPSDADAIAGLIASFQSELTDDPSGVGAEEYLASVSVRAEREYLASERYRYLLAYSNSQLAGFIAIRDGSHLFHLFVDRSHQRLGIARRLWERAV